MATQTVQIKASGMMCSFCTMSVEKALKKLPGVESVMVNLVHQVVLVTADVSQTSADALAKEVGALGYPVSATEAQQHAKNLAFHKMVRWRGLLAMALSILILLVDSLNVFALERTPRTVFSLVVAGFILTWVGSPVWKRSVSALRKGVLNANVLVSAATWSALIAGGLSLVDDQWPNFIPVAAWLVALHIFSNYFKLGTNLKAAEAVRGLLSLQPPRARVVRGGSEVDVDVADVVQGETVVVRPGERIPLDGEVTSGLASVDESSFTGESVPAAKEPGSAVIGGTLNLDGALEVRVTKVGEESFLAQLVRLMSQVSDRKAPIELLADRLMNYYGPGVLILGAVAFLVWAVATRDLIDASAVAIATLIMGYPCALGMTTPMLAAIAGGKGISIGLLVKSGEVFQHLAQIDTVVFDKTGTLTYGRPTVTEVVAAGVPEQDLLRWAGSVEANSEHPLGRAIGFYAEARGVSLVPVSDFRSTPGKGIRGSVDGSEVLVGNLAYVTTSGVRMGSTVRNDAERLAAEGMTTAVVARGGDALGVIALQDTPRSGVEDLFAKLRTRGVRTVLLTGDSPAVAHSIASSLGIDEVKAQLLPADKVSEIEGLQKAGHKVAMVGDGINDGPALLQADVGVAVGAGTDVAIESAGVILLGDRVNDVYGALVLGRASHRTMQVNVGMAVLFNIVGIALAALGLITPGFAIGFMVVSIIGILLNTLRIRTLDLGRSPTEREDAGLADAEFRVPSMHCEGCAATITEALGPLPGVREVTPMVAQKEVYVRYEPAKVGTARIKEALEEAGFLSVEA